MEWSRRLRVMEKIAASRRDPMGPPPLIPAPPPAPPTHVPQPMAHSQTGKAYRTPVARSLAMRQMAGRVGNEHVVAAPPPEQTIPAPAAPSAAPAAPSAAPAAPSADPLYMKRGRGYGWLANQINKGRDPEQQLRWQDLRKVMGGQMLHAGEKFDYSKLRGLSPDTVSLGLKSPEKPMTMPWQSDPSDLAREIKAGQAARQARRKRHLAQLAKAREFKRAKRYAGVVLQRGGPGHVPPGGESLWGGRAPFSQEALRHTEAL